MKMFSMAVGAALALAGVTTPAQAQQYVGRDLVPNGVPNLGGPSTGQSAGLGAWVPVGNRSNSNLAYSQFSSGLSGLSTETFELFDANTAACRFSTSSQTQTLCDAAPTNFDAFVTSLGVYGTISGTGAGAGVTHRGYCYGGNGPNLCNDGSSSDDSEQDRYSVSGPDQLNYGNDNSDGFTNGGVVPNGPYNDNNVNGLYYRVPESITISFFSNASRTTRTTLNAFGFYGIDVGDGSNPQDLLIDYLLSGNVQFSQSYSYGDGNSGNLLFAGGKSVQSFDQVRIRSGAGNFGDVWAIDNLTAGRVSTVPEPSTYALMGAGLLGIFGVARRRNRNA